jgi:hypothetical protein
VLSQQLVILMGLVLVVFKVAPKSEHFVVVPANPGD